MSPTREVLLSPKLAIDTSMKYGNEIPSSEERIAMLEKKLSELVSQLNNQKQKSSSNDREDSDDEDRSSSDDNKSLNEEQDEHTDDDDDENCHNGIDGTKHLELYLQQISVPYSKETNTWKEFQVKYRDDSKSLFYCYAFEVFLNSKDALGKEKSGISGTLPLKQRPLALRIQSFSILTNLFDLGLDFDIDSFEPILMTHPFKWLFYNAERIKKRTDELHKGAPANQKPVLRQNTTRGKPLRRGTVREPTKSLQEQAKSPTAATVEIKKLTKRPTFVQADESPDGPQPKMGDHWVETEHPGYCTCHECHEKQKNHFLKSPNAFDDMSCLVEFIQRYIEPKRALAQNLSGGMTISFADLWYLFQPGTDICTKGYRDHFSIGEPVKLDNKGHQNLTVWRVHSTAGGYWTPNRESVDETTRDATTSNFRSQGSFCPLKIKAYCIDFDATSFGAVQATFNIEAYAGEKDITSLTVFPLNCLKHSAIIRNNARQYAPRLEQYQKNKKLQHQYYEGRAFVVRHRDNENWSDKKASCYPEHIDSAVIVDIVMAQQEFPDSSKRLGVVEPLPSMDDDYDYEWISDQRQVYFREDASGRKQSSRDLESCECFMTGNEDEVDTSTKIEGVKLTPLVDLQECKERFEDLRTDDYILLPSKVFAYVLRARKFALVELKDLTDFSEDETSFDQLVIDPNYKKIVEAMVLNHFEMKKLGRVERRKADGPTTQLTYDNDIVRGKGRGLVILLHGAPGVGKTSTAECVAAKFRKPLLPITCADLGTNATSVEAALDKIFNYAYRWDCILLLDEADVFLSSRTTQDIERNGLVSVFLRILEYYRGILFLTTNRVGHFDEAFKSRIHLVLHYPPLSWDQTKEILISNLYRSTHVSQQNPPIKEANTKMIHCTMETAKKIITYVKSHYEYSQTKHCVWNARQIRNAVRTAIALAEFEYEANRTDKHSSEEASTDYGVILQPNHVQDVMEMSTQFDDYLRKTHNNRSTAQIALSKGERADSYKGQAQTEVNNRTRQSISQQFSPSPAYHPMLGPSPYPAPLAENLVHRPYNGFPQQLSQQPGLVPVPSNTAVSSNLAPQLMYTSEYQQGSMAPSPRLTTPFLEPILPWVDSDSSTNQNAKVENRRFQPMLQNENETSESDIWNI